MVGDRAEDGGSEPGLAAGERPGLVDAAAAAAAAAADASVVAAATAAAFDATGSAITTVVRE